MVGIVAGHDRSVDDLFQGVRTGFTGLDLDEIEHLALAVEQEIVETEENAGSLTKFQPRPRPLGDTRSLSRKSDIVRGATWYLAEHLATERGMHEQSVPSATTGDALTRQSI